VAPSARASRQPILSRRLLSPPEIPAANPKIAEFRYRFYRSLTGELTRGCKIMIAIKPAAAASEVWNPAAPARFQPEGLLQVSNSQSLLLDELESAFQMGLQMGLQTGLQTGLAEKRIETLRRVIDLFLGGADGFNDEQIGVGVGMIVSIVQTWLEARRTIKPPRCINCSKTMRHSCTHNETSEFEQRVYECVGCRSTQSFVTALS
jgi:hypothetical protein